MIENINRTARVVFLGFIVVSLGLIYWQFVRAPELLARPDNPRLVEEEQRIDRGRILSADGTVLARSEFGAGRVAKRIYTIPLLAPVTGFHNMRYGTAGIEAAYNDALRGVGDPDFIGYLRHTLLHERQVGLDVKLTIDLELQRTADRLLGNRAGAIILLDPKTGAILALASHPTYDPNTLEEQFDPIRSSPANLLLNRATQGLYPPGSIFKTVTLSAALQEGIVAPSDTFEDGQAVLHVEGFPIRCNNNPPGVNKFDLAHAFGWSCNVTFARLGLKLGLSRFEVYARRFGLGERIPFELPVAISQISNDAQISQVELASAAFGQGELLVTPLQMALIAAGIANDGRIPEPHLLDEVRTRDGQVVRKAQPQTWHTPINPDVAPKVREMMGIAVNEGWAKAARIQGVQVGGKTGTAQLGGENTQPHAWFLGIAPLDDPRFVVVILVEHGGEGSEVAAPLARQMLQAAFARSR